MKEIVNLTSRPIVLGDGTIVAATSTEGSVKRVEEISDADARRLGDSIAVRDVAVESSKTPSQDSTRARSVAKE